MTPLRSGMALEEAAERRRQHDLSAPPSETVSPSHVTGAVWIGIGAALAVLSSGARVSQLRWLGLTVSLGVAGEVVLTAALRRFF